MNTQILHKIKENSILLFVWIAFSLITGFAVAAVFTTGGNLNQFYQQGDFLPFYVESFINNGQNITYSSANDTFTVTAENALFRLSSSSKENDWHYLNITLCPQNADNLDIKMVYYDRNENWVGEDSFSIPSDEHVYQVTGEAFSSIVVMINEPVGTSFSIQQFELTTENNEKNTLFPMVGLLLSLITLIAVAGICSAVRKRKKHIEYYSFINGLQTIYILIGNRMFPIRKKISNRICVPLRIGIMIVMFTALSFVNVYNYFFDEAWHPYILLVLTACLLLLAFLSMEQLLQRKNWKNPLVLSWSVLWLMSCISDFFVTKKSPYFAFYGYVILLAAGFLFFVWSNAKNREHILWEICKALEGTYFLCVIYCLLCRPHTEGYRYKGFYTNPNPFGLYLAIVICAFLCELNRYITIRKDRRTHLICYLCGMASAIFFLLKSQCTTGVAAVGAVCLFWGAGKLFSKAKAERKRFLQTILLLAVCYLPLSLALQWGILNLPGILHTQIVYPNDADIACIQEYEFPTGTVTVYAQGNESDAVSSDSAGHILDKLFHSHSLNGILSGRLYHFRTYLREMNLLGHEKRAVVYGSYINSPHNGFLSYAHMYGVYILIPYTLFFISYFAKAFRYRKKMAKISCYSFLPLSVCIVFFLENLMDNVDIPFHWIVWFIFIFTGGFLFETEESIYTKEDNHVFP